MFKYIQEKLKDAKGVIKIRKSKKNKQHNYQKKMDNNTNNDLNIKLKIEQHESGGTQKLWKGK